MIKMKAIRPKPFNKEAFAQEQGRAFSAIGRLFKEDFDSSVKDWQGARPSFSPLVELRRGLITVTVEPAGDAGGVQKYTWLVEGTGPHLIQARPGGVLAFQTGGGRTNPPRRIESQPAGPPTGPVIYTTTVNHPGTPEHPIPRLIRERRAKEVRQMVQDATDRGARRSGHHYR